MDDLVQWLRREITSDKIHWTNSKWANARDHLARCEAHTAILDRYERAAAREQGNSISTYNNGADQGYLDAWEEAVRLVGTAYQRRYRYRDEWRPQ